ncbi:MAG: DNA primase [Flavobacteriales bacterium]|nr:DNA primase [Flavobacteriales bacterium]
MIPQETIGKIFDSADIVEVIGDFIHLKKSGSNFKGLSPFANEKTPSFMVSPGKRIFKDFSSGKGGNVVTFLMEHEQLSYPEALKWLANKYNIEIEEAEETKEQIEAKHQKEALYLAHQFANDFFKTSLKDSNEGKSVGLSYLKKRGYNISTIDEFELGYSPDDYNALENEAKKANYSLGPLKISGLIKEGEKGNYDFFRGRIIFPIHNITGRIIGFGGRTLRTDKKVAKYFNSPESDIYNKSNVLYGLFQSKNEIIKNDSCLLVEGYTDVISLHHNGIKNAVSSSGTSLTEGQIRLIKRFTNNVVILYDSDPAGINASFRGVDMILKAGLNVKVVLFPEGEDPDSYAHQLSNEDFKSYLNDNQIDFISFKANHLLEKTKNDPINISKTINNIIISISIIPDAVSRSVYIKKTAQIFEMDEELLINEVRKKLRPNENFQSSNSLPSLASKNLPSKSFQKGIKHDLSKQEEDLIRLMLTYGAHSIKIEVLNENEKSTVEYPLAQFIVEEILTDKLSYENEKYQLVFNEFLEGLEKGLILNEQHFVQNHNLTSLVADLTTSQNILSKNWKKKHQIHTKIESERLKQAAEQAVFIFKLRVTENLILDKQKALKEMNPEEDNESILKEIKELIKVRNIFADELGIIVTQ